MCISSFSSCLTLHVRFRLLNFKSVRMSYQLFHPMLPMLAREETLRQTESILQLENLSHFCPLFGWLPGFTDIFNRNQETMHSVRFLGQNKGWWGMGVGGGWEESSVSPVKVSQSKSHVLCDVM